MKKVFKVLGIVLLVVVALLIVIPIVFRGPIEKIVKEEINKASGMTIDYTDFSLSIFTSFPSLRAGLEGIMVADSTAVDTLATAQNVDIDVDLWGAIVNQKLAINKVAVENANVAYTDSAMAAYVNNINVLVKGNMDMELTTLKVALDVENIKFFMDEQKLVDGAAIDFDANIDADLANSKFTFKDNTLNLAGIPLAFEGWVQLIDSTAIELDVRLAALETSFKTLLALVPEAYLKDVAGLETTGSLELAATAKGTYVSVDTLPAINAVLKINDGKVKYPDLPKSLNNINIDVAVANPGKDLDAFTVDVNKFHLELGNNPFDIDLNLLTPISNPTFKANVVGVIDLNTLKDCIPLDSIAIGGIIDADVHVATDLKTIEAEKYEEVKAEGAVALTNFNFTSSDLPMGALIPAAKLKFTPKALELNPLIVNVGKSDFDFTGKVDDYLTYVLSDGTIKGTFALKSNMIDANELMGLAGEPAAEAADSLAVTEPEAAEEGIVSVPKNIDASFSLQIAKLLYDKLEITNTVGGIYAKDGVAYLKNVGLNLCDGRVGLNGQYNTADTLKPFIDMNIDLDGVEINKLTNSFAVVDSMLPIAKSAHGRINIGMALRTDLDQQMSPVLSSMNGNGSFRSADIALKDSEFQQKLCQLLGNDKYANLSVKDASAKFTIENGNVVIEPFKIKMLGKEATFGGRQGLDQTMDYKLSIPFSRKEVIEMAKLSSVVSPEGADLPVGIGIGGELRKPKLSLDLKDATAAITGEAKEKVKAVVDEKVAEVKEKVEEKVEEAKAEAMEKATEVITEKLGESEEVKKATEGAKNLMKGLFKKK